MSKRKKQKQRIKERQREAWQTQKSQRKTVRHNTAVNQEKHRADWQPLQPDEFGMVADRRINLDNRHMITLGFNGGALCESQEIQIGGFATSRYTA